MRLSSYIFVLFILAHLVISCEDEKGDGISGYRPFLTVSPSVRRLPNDNDSASFRIEAEGAWTASDTVDWFIMQPDSGRGDGLIMVYVSRFNGPARSGAITIRAPGHQPDSVAVRVEQNPEPALKVRPDSLCVAYDDTAATLSVQAQGPWTVHEDIIWVSAEPLAGDGDGSFTVRFELNTGPDRRASLFVTAPGHTPLDKEVVLVQLDAPDTLEVAPSVREMDWEGSIVPFTIRARGSWTASAPDEWLEILPPASGSGTDYIRVSAGENAGGFRQGSVVVTAPGHRPESVTVHVNQAASPHSAPEAPSHLMVTTVYWDVAGVTWRDRSNNETKFQVERRRENDQWLLRAEPSAGAIIFVDSLVEANTLYSYRVRSANDYGASEPSNAVSFLTNSAPVTLVVNDPPLESLLSPHGDIDWFKLPITSAGQFTIETTLRGLQNSQIWLFGPDNRETEIAYDNDSGYGLASKIAENLNIGIYYVRVAGVPDSTMGNYFITARPEGR